MKTKTIKIAGVIALLFVLVTGGLVLRAGMEERARNAELAAGAARKAEVDAQLKQMRVESVHEIYRIGVRAAEAEADLARKNGERVLDIEQLKDLRIARARVERDSALAALK